MGAEASFPVWHGVEHTVEVDQQQLAVGAVSPLVIIFQMQTHAEEVFVIAVDPFPVLWFLIEFGGLHIIKGSVWRQGSHRYVGHLQFR